MRQFVATGIPDKQAEVIVAAISRAASEIVTRADLAVAELKADMLKVAIGVAVGIVIVIVNASLTITLIKLL